MNPKRPQGANPARIPPPPTHRVINHEITNKELGKLIQKAVAGEAEPTARVLLGESPERDGWAIHFLFIEGTFDSEAPRDKLVMYPSDTKGTNLVTQRGRVMTWVRLEALLDQVSKWIGGAGEVTLHFYWPGKV